MIYGKDPITKETIEINEWLNETDDNILLILDKSAKNVSFSRSDSGMKNKINDKIYLFKRSYLQVPELKHIYHQCILEQGQLMVNETFKSKISYYNLGYYLGKPILIDLKEAISKNVNKHRIFKLNFSYNEFDDFINKESLLMSQIALSTKKLLKAPKGATIEEKKRINDANKMETYNAKKNLPIKKEVYFEEVMAKALLNYSYQWDSAINFYLRSGEDYFNTPIFIQYHKRFGKTINEAIANVKQKVLDIDRAFLEVAPRNENNSNVYFRGMQRPFEKLANIGDKETISNFISVSSAYNVALRFSGILRGSQCCLYRLQIDKGIPIIDMVRTTKFKQEKEILLPRNLVFELVNIDVIEYLKRHVPIANIKVHLQDKDQFKLTTGCKKFLVGNIVPYSPSYIVNETKKAHKKEDKKTIAKDENKKPLKIDTKYEELIENHKIALIGKRCPKGYRIHKPTNMCEFFGVVQGKSQTKTKPRTKKKSPVKTGTKKPRCKNGTRRNPKTGNCEAF
tara:strand:- start:4540 stop:6072 length:1533 start_codon:yes stop_codon:yes gene_type:complete